jgi:hypothetical protein
LSPLSKVATCRDPLKAKPHELAATSRRIGKR